MTPQELNKIAPIIKDARGWEAFNVLMDNYQAEILNRLRGILDSNDLIRLNAQFILIEKMRKARETWLSFERNME